jgi:hypothetical protein
MRYWPAAEFKLNVVFRMISMEAFGNLVEGNLGVMILSGMVYRCWSV